MQSLIDSINSIRTVEAAKTFLLQKVELDSDKIVAAADFSIAAHEGQKRKSGEEYAVHPLLVASIVAHFGGNTHMILAALLHDVVEDTGHDKEHITKLFGEEVGELVDGLTKIDEIRETELVSSSTDEKLLKSALSFRKMLSTAINDPRVLVIKLCDRLHNLLTIGALEPKKQKRVAEESLVVYAPIAHKLGIAKLKNYIEDLSFAVLFPHDYQRIKNYFKENEQSIILLFNTIISKIENHLIENGFEKERFVIHSRIKHYYSIHQKMQRKGVTMEEVLDLLALRILVKDSLECYRVLGVLHQFFKPLVSRFKDYIAIPKENGYQTIHTTLFFEGAIFEAQIRTFDMEDVAEFGIAAHHNYKAGILSHGTQWLKNFEYQNETIEEFYELAKNDLFSDEIVVYSPKGELFGLPTGATALDFAYAVHTHVGNCAKEAFVNKVGVPLLHELSSGDICKIELADKPIPRCSWVGAVKTSRAKNSMRNLCAQKLKELDRRVAKNILTLTFGYDYYELRSWLDENRYSDQLHRVPRDHDFYVELIKKIKEESSLKSRSLFTRIMGIKLKRYHFDHLDFYSNHSIGELSFDVCCHPKKWDDIVAFYTKGRITIHHKLCSVADEMIAKHEPMVFVEWSKDKIRAYKVVVSLQNKKGALAEFVNLLSKYDTNILMLHIGHSNTLTDYCEVEMEIRHDFKALKDKIAAYFKLIEFTAKDDAYKENP